MTTSVSNHLFNETTLKNAIACALLMSSIDGEVHEKEWAVIQGFVEKYWKEDYQHFPLYKSEMEHEIEQLLVGGKSLQSRINQRVTQLTGNLNSSQKNIVLNLVGDVMVADGMMTLEESKLFATFMEKLGIRIF